MNLEKLCISLASCNEAKEVKKVLQKEGYWNDPKSWEDFDDNPNNWSSIGNQQTKSINALVEKMVNSGDSILTSKCIEQGINPEDIKNAPASLKEAIIKFLNVPNADLSQLDSQQRTALAKKSGGVVTSGNSDYPTYTVFDFGEGQAPEKFPDTFLGLARSNKLGIPFVQGKHCTGGTGSIVYCKDGLQLIISRRSPILNDTSVSDDIGFTVLRKFDASSTTRSPVVKYLKINNKIPSFPFKPLPILPAEGNKNVCVNDWEYGAFIKMFDYDIGRTLRSKGNMDLLYKLSLLLPSPVFPVRFYERRGVKGHTPENNLNGLLTRLSTDRSTAVEPNTPFGFTFSVDNQQFNCEVYVLQSHLPSNVINTRWHGEKGIIYTLNGQGNGFIDRAFYRRRKVGMQYLENKIITLVDCSELDNHHISQMFMNNRENTRESAFFKDVESELENLISSHQGLKSLMAKHRDQSIQNRIANQQPVEDVLTNLMKNNPLLSKTLISGLRISNPFKTSIGGGNWVSSYYPTYFNLDKKSKNFTKNKPRKIESTRTARIGFTTDAPNDYLTRTTDNGTYDVKIDGQLLNNRPALIGVDGSWYLHLNLTNTSVGQKHEVEITLTDVSRPSPFKESFWVETTPYIKRSGGKTGGKKKTGRGTGSGSTTQNLQLPPLTHVKNGDQNWLNLNFDDRSALCIMDAGKSKYDFFINMDNIHLLNEIKLAKSSDKQVVENQYTMGMFLVGLGLAYEYEKNHISDLQAESTKISRYLSQLMVPMIRELGAI